MSSQKELDKHNDNDEDNEDDEEEEVNKFIEDLFHKKFNEQSKIISDLFDGDMEIFISYHPIEIDDVFDFIIISSMDLKRYDIISHFISKMPFRFHEDLFENECDFCEGFRFCIENGIEFDLQRLFFEFCSYGCIHCLKYLVEEKNIQIKEEEFYYEEFNCLHLSTINFRRENLEVTKYLIQKLNYNINYLAYYYDDEGQTCLDMALAERKNGNCPEWFVSELISLGAKRHSQN